MYQIFNCVRKHINIIICAHITKIKLHAATRTQKIGYKPVKPDPESNRVKWGVSRYGIKDGASIITFYLKVHPKNIYNS